MKKVKKIVTTVAVVLVVLILVVVVGFSLFGEGAIKTAVEKAASNALGVAVTIDSVDLSILKGQVDLKGLVVANPEGYEHETLLELASGVVDVGIGSLLSDTVNIEDMTLEGIRLTMEQKGLTNNLQEILKRLPKEEEKEEPQAKPAKNLHVDKLEITDTNVKVKLLPVPGKVDTLSLNLDPIVMEDLGTESKLSIARLTGKILAALAIGVAKQGAGVLPDDMIKGMGSALGITLDLGKAATEQGQKLIETTTDTGKGVLEGLGGLLGGKKEE